MRIPAVKIEFKELPDFICEKEYWDDHGGYAGVMRELNQPFKAVKKVHHILLYPHQFPENEWGP
jgi:hypothetical protein